MIGPTLWDDPQFVDLPMFEQKLWLYLLTGPEAVSSCPGLLLLGIGGLSEAMRTSTSVVELGLRRLSALGWLEEDRRHRLIRIPKAPTYRVPDSGELSTRAIYAWYRRWIRVPNCTLKYNHVESIRSVMTDKGLSTSAWEKTFGAVIKPRCNGAESRPQEPQLSLVPKLSENSRNGLDPMYSYSYPDSYPEPYPDDENDRGVDKPVAGVDNSPQPAQPPSSPRAQRLWERLQAARADLDLATSPMPPGADSVITQLLQAEYSVEQLEHVIDAAKLRADADPKAEWLLNGIDTWKPNVIDRMLTLRAAPRKKKRKPVKTLNEVVAEWRA